MNLVLLVYLGQLDYLELEFKERRCSFHILFTPHLNVYREYFILNNYLTNLFREWRAQKDHLALEGYQDRDYLDQRLGNFLK